MNTTSTANGLRASGLRALPAPDWARLRAWRGRRAEVWPIAGGVAIAVIAGWFAGVGLWLFAVAIVVTPAFLIIAAAAPERTALGLIVVLPFMFYPAAVGGFSLFVAVPTFGFTGLMLMMRQRSSLHGMRRLLPVPLFALLVVIAIYTSVASSDLATAFSRVLYLALFGWFAWALATSIFSGRLTREAVAKAVVWSGAIAALAVLIQFLWQFGAGKESVISWLRSVQATFAGERAAGISTINWVINDFNLLRGIFPFMSPPMAGQYLMLCLVAAIWLRRERKDPTPAGSAVQLGIVVLIAAGLLVTFSRQAWLGALVGVIALGIKQKPLWMFAVIAEIFLILTVVPIPGGHGSFGEYLLTASDTSTTSSGTRLALWTQAFDHIPDHVFLGVGPGLYGTLNPNPANPVYYSHNIFLDELVELGALGGLAFIALFALALRSAFKRSATLAFSMLTAYVVANLFDSVLYTPRNGLLLAVAFALIAGSEPTHKAGRVRSVRSPLATTQPGVPRSPPRSSRTALRHGTPAR
jgi:O-antigen ligase